jgi:hypothetical protein
MARSLLIQTVAAPSFMPALIVGTRKFVQIGRMWGIAREGVEALTMGDSQRVESMMGVGKRLEASFPTGYGGDTLLPGQYYDIVGRRQWQDGEYRLAFAVLADALACFYRYRDAKSRKARLLFEEVRLWMHSYSRNGVFAFRNLCEVLGIDPDALTATLEKRRDLGEPALREIRVWRGKPRRGLTAPTSRQSWHRSARPAADAASKHGGCARLPDALLSWTVPSILSRLSARPLWASDEQVGGWVSIELRW